MRVILRKLLRYFLFAAAVSAIPDLATILYRILWRSAQTYRLPLRGILAQSMLQPAMRMDLVESLGFNRQLLAGQQAGDTLLSRISIHRAAVLALRGIVP